MEQKDYLLEVDNLVKYFPIKTGFFKRTTGYVKAVDGISFKIERGKTMGLVGESISGGKIGTAAGFLARDFA